MIACTLDGRPLAVAVGAVVASPAFPALRAQDVETGAATAIASISMNPDGTFELDGTANAAQSGAWYIPSTGGVGAGYEVLITPTLRSGPAGLVSNAAATWIGLSSTRVFKLTIQQLTAGTAHSVYDVLVQVRVAGTPGIVSSGTVSVDATATAYEGGDGGCVCPAMFVRPGRQARDARAGDLFDCLDMHHSGRKTFEAPLLATEIGEEECVRLCTDRGAMLECSVSTPFDLLDGRTTRAPQMLGELVITDWGIETVTAVQPIGLQLVCHNHLGGLSYAAGADPFHRIFSHNPQKV